MLFQVQGRNKLDSKQTFSFQCELSEEEFTVHNLLRRTHDFFFLCYHLHLLYT